ADCTEYCSNSCPFCNGQPLYQLCCINNCCPS
nr:Chain A, Wisotide [Withania somnifera]